MAVATSGFWELQECNDSGRQGGEQVMPVMHNAVTMFAKLRVLQRPLGLVLSVILPVLRGPRFPLCLHVLSALQFCLLGIL